MRRIFLASGAMSIKIPDKIETILINIHQRLRANPPHASPRLARLRRGGQGPRGEGLQYWHWYCDEYTIHATHTETVPTSERLRLTNLWISCGDNLFQYLLSSGSFQQLPNAFSDDCVLMVPARIIISAGRGYKMEAENRAARRRFSRVMKNFAGKPPVPAPVDFTIVYISQCDCQNWRTGAIPDEDGWCLVSRDSWLIGCGIWDEG